MQEPHDRRQTIDGITKIASPWMSQVVIFSNWNVTTLFRTSFTLRGKFKENRLCLFIVPGLTSVSWNEFPFLSQISTHHRFQPAPHMRGIACGRGPARSQMSTFLHISAYVLVAFPYATKHSCWGTSTTPLPTLPHYFHLSTAGWSQEISLFVQPRYTV